MQNLRAQSPNLDKNELRMSRYGIHELFMQQTGAPGGIVSADLEERAFASIGRVLEVPVFDYDGTVSVTNTRTLTIPDSENTSRMLQITFSTVSWGFTMTPAMYINNEVGEQQDFNRKMLKYIYLVAATMDNAGGAALEAAKTQVLNDSLGGQFSLTANTLRVPVAKAKSVVGSVDALFEGNDHYDPITVVGNPSFKDNIIKTEELAKEQEEIQGMREERTNKISSLTKNFDSGVSVLLESVGTAISDMEGTAKSMSDIAQRTKERATVVSGAAQNASVNVQSVASATEELSYSIKEISQQVNQSSEITSKAVAEAGKTDQQIQGLANTADQIGDVVSLISDIAEQTNLLALNATIEAARAGDAGKGFAVVASEVKNLANQTAKATEQISSQIEAVQSDTKSAVTAIQSITSTIGEINQIASAIAAAVEEQGAATSEISRNIELAANGAGEVTNNIESVSLAANDTGAASEQVSAATRELNSKADNLRGEVETFLNAIRSA